MVEYCRNWSTMGKSEKVQEISKPCSLVQQHSCRLRRHTR
uniref:Uncharacterized protein n=1 Tax=Arundo donax TaxID=35708 RepID=A0A0A9DCF7_ARUDO